MLPKLVEQDSDLPEPLNTASKQEKRAKQLAAAHLGKKAYRIHSPSMQGFYSRTHVVKMVGGEKVVIQFRIQPLDIECFKKARCLLGNVVPEIQKLQDKELEALGISVFAMSYMPGNCWIQIPSRDTEARIRAAKSLGAAMGCGLVEGSSVGVVKDYILPTLERFRDSINERTEALRPYVERLITAAPQLEKLPLYFSHYDLNNVNVLVGEDGVVSGIVDWECAKDLPFGIGLHRLTDTIVARNSRGEIRIPEESKEAEKAFWDAVLSQAPPVVLNNLEVVQSALHIGSLIFATQEGGLERHFRFHVAMLSYRMPQLRGDTGPFAPEYMSQ